MEALFHNDKTQAQKMKIKQSARGSRWTISKPPFTHDFFGRMQILQQGWTFWGWFFFFTDYWLNVSHFCPKEKKQSWETEKQDIAHPCFNYLWTAQRQDEPTSSSSPSQPPNLYILDQTELGGKCMDASLKAFWKFGGFMTDDWWWFDSFSFSFFSRTRTACHW